MADDFPALVYLDTFEIFEADDEGCASETQVAAMTGGDGEAERLGVLFAAAPSLLRAAKLAERALEEMTRNYIASLPDEYHDAMDALRAAFAEAEV